MFSFIVDTESDELVIQYLANVPCNLEKCTDVLDLLTRKVYKTNYGKKIPDSELDVILLWERSYLKIFEVKAAHSDITYELGFYLEENHAKLVSVIVYKHDDKKFMLTVNANNRTWEPTNAIEEYLGSFEVFAGKCKKPYIIDNDSDLWHKRVDRIKVIADIISR